VAQFGENDSYQGIASAMPSAQREATGLSRLSSAKATLSAEADVLEPSWHASKARPDTNLYSKPHHCGRFPQVGLGYPTLTEKIHSYRIAAS
jgi:hypothetical protein